MFDLRSRNMMNPLVIATLMLPMFVMADYKCLCNYGVETRVYADVNQSSPTLGFMFEFDCKATIPYRTLPAKWQAVAFKHQVGYVRTDQEVQIQMCPGSPPNRDPQTPTIPVTTASTTQTITPTTTIESTTTSTTTRATTTSTTVKPTPAAPVRQGMRIHD